jgi:hypothetical protein
MEENKMENKELPHGPNSFEEFIIGSAIFIGGLYLMFGFGEPIKQSRSLESEVSIEQTERAPREIYDIRTRTMNNDPAYVNSVSKYASGMFRRYTLSQAAAGLSVRLGQEKGLNK